MIQFRTFIMNYLPVQITAVVSETVNGIPVRYILRTAV